MIRKQRRLARSALADERDRLAVVDLHAHAAQGVDDVFRH